MLTDYCGRKVVSRTIYQYGNFILHNKDALKTKQLYIIPIPMIRADNIQLTSIHEGLNTPLCT